MVQKVWLGGIYLKYEGGYEIILKSLEHYKNRLKTLNDSPELKDSAAMFASVLNQQARKTVPEINKMIEKIYKNLSHSENINELQEDTSLFEKALSCYASDIHKAKDTKLEYFIKLVGDVEKAQLDLDIIKIALDKIKQFSE